MLAILAAATEPVKLAAGKSLPLSSRVPVTSGNVIVLSVSVLGAAIVKTPDHDACPVNFILLMYLL